MFKSLCLVIIVQLGSSFTISANAQTAMIPSPSSTVKNVIEPESIDYLDAKITIDKLIDTAADSRFVRSEVDRMEAEILSILKPRASDKEKAMVLRSYLYDSGPWNDFKPFTYDLDDPQGKSETSRLLHYYLKTRLGNCVSMPVLQAILGRRLGLDMTLAIAPNHILITFTPEGGEQIFIEATSGGYPARLEWYRKNLPMTDLALKDSLFMKKLNDRQAVGAMANDLIVYLLRDGETEQARLTLSVTGKHMGRAPQIYILHSMIYSQKLYEEFYSLYPTENEMPLDLMPVFQNYRYQEEYGVSMAEKLGYFGLE